MNWHIKAAVQGVLARAPYGEVLNDSLQLRIGGLRNFDQQVASKVGDWVGMVQLLKETGVNLADATMIEVGTGWFPVFPICFWLAGARKCITYDLRRHLNPNLVHRCVRSLERHLGAIAEAVGVSVSDIRDRYARVQDDVLSSCNISYVAPGDVCHTGLPDASIDILYSNSVLEHVKKAALTKLFRESLRILRPLGVVVHCVACNDHYSHFDLNISSVNYLRFSERQWRWWNNVLQYQNRLRAGDFLRVAEQTGLRIVAKRTYKSGNVNTALSHLHIAEEFCQYTQEELGITTVNFVASRPPST